MNANTQKLLRLLTSTEKIDRENADVKKNVTEFLTNYNTITEAGNSELTGEMFDTIIQLYKPIEMDLSGMSMTQRREHILLIVQKGQDKDKTLEAYLDELAEAKNKEEVLGGKISETRGELAVNKDRYVQIDRQESARFADSMDFMQGATESGMGISPTQRGLVDLGLDIGLESDLGAYGESDYSVDDVVFEFTIDDPSDGVVRLSGQDPMVKWTISDPLLGQIEFGEKELSSVPDIANFKLGLMSGYVASRKDMVIGKQKKLNVQLGNQSGVHNLIVNNKELVQRYKNNHQELAKILREREEHTREEVLRNRRDNLRFLQAKQIQGKSDVGMQPNT